MKHLVRLIKDNKLAAFALILFIGILCIVVATKAGERDDDLVPVTVKAIRTAGGWGYEILTDGKVYIHQEFVPAVEGKKSFKTENDALFVANKAMEKLVKGKGKLPVITVEELKQWGIAMQEKM